MCDITVLSMITFGADVITIDLMGVTVGSTILCHPSLSLAQC